MFAVNALRSWWAYFFMMKVDEMSRFLSSWWCEKNFLYLLASSSGHVWSATCHHVTVFIFNGVYVFLSYLSCISSLYAVAVTNNSQAVPCIGILYYVKVHYNMRCSCDDGEMSIRWNELIKSAYIQLKWLQDTCLSFPASASACSWLAAMSGWSCMHQDHDIGKCTNKYSC